MRGSLAFLLAHSACQSAEDLLVAMAVYSTVRSALTEMKLLE